MALIRATAFTIIDKDWEVRKKYEEHINSLTKKRSNKLDVELEHGLATVFGAKVVGGNKQLVPDFVIDENLENLLKVLPFEKDSEQNLVKVEAKFGYSERSANTLTKIGGVRINTKNILPELTRSRSSFIGDRSEFNTARFANKGETLDQQKEYNTALKLAISNLIKKSKAKNTFDFFKNTSEKFFNKAYEKAKNLAMVKVYNGSPVVYNIYFPKEKFNSSIFEMSVVGSSTTSKSKPYIRVDVKLKSNFEKSLIDKLNKFIIKADYASLQSIQSAATNLKYENMSVEYGKKSSETISIGWNHTQSITQATGTLNIIVPTLKAPKPITGTSIIDITQLVQGRVKLKMRRGTGAPYPEKIYERTGTFRGSIKAFADINSKIVSYFYLPYYDSLEEYGYEIQGLVEDSIRAVVRERFNSNFNLKRRM